MIQRRWGQRTVRQGQPNTPEIRRAMSAYGLNRHALRQLAASSPDRLRGALRVHDPADELTLLLALLHALVTPAARKRVPGSAELAAALAVRLEPIDQEQLLSVCLDNCNSIQAIAPVPLGGATQAGELLRPALYHSSRRVVIVHARPSGAAEPSEQDYALTYDCLRLGKRLDIQVVDHLIISADRYISLRDWLKEGWPTPLEAQGGGPGS